MKRCIIVDIDGTVADRGARFIHDYDTVISDNLQEDIVELVQSLQLEDEVDMVYVSGRPERCRRDTTLWLNQVANLRVDALYMRPDMLPNGKPNHRPDFIIKKEIYDEFIAPNYKVWFALDDRDQIVRMWRDNGIRCLQVRDGNY